MAKVHATHMVIVNVMMGIKVLIVHGKLKFLQMAIKTPSLSMEHNGPISNSSKHSERMRDTLSHLKQLMLWMSISQRVFMLILMNSRMT